MNLKKLRIDTKQLEFITTIDLKHEIDALQWEPEELTHLGEAIVKRLEIIIGNLKELKFLNKAKERIDNEPSFTIQEKEYLFNVVEKKRREMLHA